jgi:hypothetical protein
MYLINEKLYIDLSGHVDLAGLESIEKEIVIGLVKSKEYFKDSSANFVNCYDKTLPCILEAIYSKTGSKKLDNPAHPYHEYYKQLDFNEVACLMFTRYMDKYQGMGQVLSLRSFRANALEKFAPITNLIMLKGEKAASYDRPWYIENFPKLKEWVDNLKIFDEIGRVLFFINAPGEKHSIHKDTFVGHVDNFILINLALDRKSLFILDETTGEKHIIDTKVSVFDTRNWHGTDSISHTWTLRVDGKFNPEWAKSLKIWRYFNHTDI